jgi:hypothetical protein
MLAHTGFAQTRARGLRVREMLNFPNPEGHHTKIAGKGSFPPLFDEAYEKFSNEVLRLLKPLITPISSKDVRSALKEIAF